MVSDTYFDLCYHTAIVTRRHYVENRFTPSAFRQNKTHLLFTMSLNLSLNNSILVNINSVFDAAR